MNIALFVGSFDPFTIGHQAIVSRALPLFDRLVIGVGVNERKQTMFSSEERVDTLRQLYANEPRVSVVAYTDLTVDLARREGATFIVKGVRSMKDFEYEREQADINRRLTGIDTLLFFADSELASISSSMVRELMHFGRDVTPFLPVARP